MPVARRLHSLRSMRARITLAAMVVMGSALGASAVSLVAIVRDSLVDNLDEAAEIVADDIAARLRAGSLPEVIPVAGGPGDDDIVIQVVDPQRGAVVAASENYLSAAPMTTELPGRWRLRMTLSLPVDQDEDFRLTGTSVRSAAGDVMIVYVANELEPVRRSERAVRRAVQTGVPVLMVLSGSFVWILVGRALRPVELIRRQVAAISGSGLDRRVPEPAVDDEVGRLARTMNAMLERLQRSAERQRRFVSDASHELRSPLTSTRATLEVALTHPESTSLEATAADALAETERMERLISDLMFLARGDEGRLMASPGPVDLDEVVQEEIARMQTRGGVTVDASGIGRGRVWGVRRHLQRVVRNLLENAERHARSAVSVSLTSDGADLDLAVTDDGPGLAVEDRERVFDRFVRLDEARARNGGGAGLGLAIAREIVIAHGGDIGVEDAPGGGARFIVHLSSAESVPGR